MATQYLFGVQAEWEPRFQGRINRVLGIPAPSTIYSGDTHFAIVEELTPQHTATFVRWATPADAGRLDEVGLDGPQVSAWNEAPAFPSAPPWLLYPTTYRRSGRYVSGQWDAGCHEYAGVDGWFITRPKIGTSVFKMNLTGGMVWCVNGLTGVPQPLQERGFYVGDAAILRWQLAPESEREMFAAAAARAAALADASSNIPRSLSRAPYGTPASRLPISTDGVLRTVGRMERLTWDICHAALEG